MQSHENQDGAALRRLGRRARGRRGAAAMEFALILPILLLILGGIVDFARAFFELQTMVNAASEGARIAIVSTDPSVTTAYVKTQVKKFFGDPNTTVEVVPTVEAATPGDIIVVRVIRPFDQLFLGIFDLPQFGISPLPTTLTYEASGMVQ